MLKKHKINVSISMYTVSESYDTMAMMLDHIIMNAGYSMIKEQCHIKCDKECDSRVSSPSARIGSVYPQLQGDKIV